VVGDEAADAPLGGSLFDERGDRPEALHAAYCAPFPGCGPPPAARRLPAERHYPRWSKSPALARVGSTTRR
jgi:hypothetical protein